MSALTDTLTSSLDIVKILADSTGTADSVALDQSLSLSDAIQTTDLGVAGFIRSAEGNDLVSCVDSINWSLELALSDTVALQDGVEKITSHHYRLEDFAGIDETNLVELYGSSKPLRGQLVYRDYEIQLGPTVFVANLPGVLTTTGFSFLSSVLRKARLRVGSIVVNWAHIGGEQFKFLRETLGYSQEKVAADLGVPLNRVQAWEAETEEVPRLHFLELGVQVCKLDHMQTSSDFSYRHPDTQIGSRVRIFPPIGEEDLRHTIWT